MTIDRIQCRRVLERTRHASKLKCYYRILPYEGCTHGCIYCSRSIRQGQKSAGAVSEGHIGIKTNAPEILKAELKRARSKLVCLGGYQPLEREEKMIRQLLDILAARAFPVHIIARSDILLDDLDIIGRINENSFCSVTMCINTLDEDILSTFEPDAPPPKERMKALGELASAGITTGLGIMPVIPYITDSEEQLDELMRRAADRGAGYAISDVLRLEDGFRASVIHAVKRTHPTHLVKYRRLYEFGAAPESRYVRDLKSRIRILHLKYGLEEDIPYHESDKKSKQVRLEKY